MAEFGIFSRLLVDGLRGLRVAYRNPPRRVLAATLRGGAATNPVVCCRRGRRQRRAGLDIAARPALRETRNGRRRSVGHGTCGPTTKPLIAGTRSIGGCRTASQ